MAREDWLRKPDLGALAKTAQTAGGRLGRAVSDATATPREQAVGFAQAGSGAALDLGQRIAASVRDMPAPPLPLQQPWGMGLGVMLRDHPSCPGVLRPAVGRLDRFGALGFAQDRIVVDGTSVPWSKVTSLTWSTAMEMLTSSALDREVERFTATLRAFPFRSWLIGQVTDLVGGLCVAAVPPSWSAGTDGSGDAAILDRPVVAEITYRGMLRSRTLVPGVFATLLMAASPGIGQTVFHLAQMNDVPVGRAPQPRSFERAQSMRDVAGGLRSRMSRIDVAALGAEPAEPLAIEDDESAG